MTKRNIPRDKNDSNGSRAKPLRSKLTGRVLDEPPTKGDPKVEQIFAFLKGGSIDPEKVVEGRDYLYGPINDPEEGKVQVFPQDLLEKLQDLPPNAFQDAHRSLARGSGTVFTPASLPAASEEPAPAPESERKFSK